MTDERVNQLTLELAKCRQQNREILAEREGVMKELGDLRQRRQYFEAEVERLTKRLSDEASLRSLKQLEEEVELLRQENDRLFAEGKQGRHQADESEKRFGRLEHRLHEAEKEKKALEASVVSMQDEVNSAGEEVRSVRAEEESVKDRAARLERAFEWRGVLRLSGQRLLGLLRSGVLSSQDARRLVELLLERGVECTDDTLFELMRLDILSEDEVEAVFRRGVPGGA